MHLGKKTYFLPLGTTPKTGVSFIAKKITVYIYSQVPHKPACAVTEDGQKLEISHLCRRGIVLSL